MDRTAELTSLIEKPQTLEKITEKRRFYDEIYSNIQDIGYNASKASNYKILLGLEKELNGLIMKSTGLLDSMAMTGSEDLKIHFEGIKVIINRKIVETSKYLEARKTKLSNVEIELEPQRPTSFKKISENQLLEQESRNIVESMQYEATRQRLLKIEAVQKAINENLLLQDERIDSVCASNSTTGDIYNKLSNNTSITNGSVFKRAAFTIILCLSFVLIFVHFYYRN
jgi:syntaxin 18